MEPKLQTLTTAHLGKLQTISFCSSAVSADHWWVLFTSVAYFCFLDSKYVDVDNCFASAVKQLHKSHVTGSMRDWK